MAETPKKTTTSSTSGGDSGEAEVQAAFDEANEKGYFGTTPDDTPNEAYTVQGVGKGMPTPETERGKDALAEKESAQAAATKQNNS